MRAGPGADRRVRDAGRAGRRPRGVRLQPVDRRRGSRPVRRIRRDRQSSPTPWRRAAATDALIVLAVPVPALPIMLDHIRVAAPRLPADRRHQRQRCRAADGPGTTVCWTASSAGTRWPAPRIRAGRRATAAVRRRTVGDQRRRPRRRRRVGRGDAPGAGLRRRRRPRPLRRARRRRCGHLASAASARRSARGHRRATCPWRSRWPPGRSATAPGSRRPHPTWCGRCARRTPTSCTAALDRAIDLLDPGPRPPGRRRGSVAELVESRPRRPDALRQLQPAGHHDDHDRRRELARGTGRRRPRRRGDQIRSASPG